MSLFAIIVAGGSGTRMGKSLKKQYLPVAGLPLMGHALQVLDRAQEVDSLILSVPNEDMHFIEKEILTRLSLKKEIRLVAGGKTRQESVVSGLRALDSSASYVLVHDAVRPFLNQDQITRLVLAAKSHGAASLALPVTDTLRRKIGDGKSEALSRENVFSMQTPQVFRADLLIRAHERASALGILGTDDAGLVADMGEPLVLVEGSRMNIKITEPDDLVCAEALWKILGS